jgi:hypothetical protein
VWDPDPSGPPNALRTFTRLCRSAPTDEAVLVLQEDAILCRGFGRAVEAAYEAAGPACLALYVGKLYRQVAILRQLACQGRTLGDLGWREYVPLVACVLPAGLPRAFAEWAPLAMPAGWRHDDEALGAYTRSNGVEVLCTIPCLVQHDNDQPSIAGHRHHGARRAWCFIGDHDARRIRWAR